jgi:hypothetical protein
MHARAEVMQVLVAKRMKRWYSIVRCPLLDLKCPPQEHGATACVSWLSIL